MKKCKRGHDLNKENLGTRIDKGKRRNFCRACRLKSYRRYNQSVGRDENGEPPEDAYRPEDMHCLGQPCIIY